MYNFQNYLEDSGIKANLEKYKAELLADPFRGAVAEAAMSINYDLFRTQRWMLYIPQDYQMAFHCAPEKVRACIGGNKIGKTLMALMEIIWALTGRYPEWYPAALRRPLPTRVHLVVADFKEIGGDTWIPLMKEWFPTYEDPGVWETSKRKQVVDTYWLHKETGSELFMLSDQMDVEAFEGWQSDLIVVDEQCEERKYSAMHGRLLARRGRFVFVGTPLRQCAWTKREFREKSQVGDMPDGNTYYCQPSMYENKYMTYQEIDEFIARCPEDERETRLNGVFYHLSMLVFEKIVNKKADYIIPDTDIDPEWTQFFALDPHGSGLWCGIYYAIGPEGIPVVFDEVYETKTLLDDVTNVLFAQEEAQSHGSRPPDIKIIDWWCETPDAKDGRSYVDAFEDAGYTGFETYDKFPGSVDQHFDLCCNRGKVIERDIPKDSWFVKAGILPPGKYRGPGILFMQRCKRFIASLGDFTEEQKKKKEKHMPDCWKMIEAYNPQYTQPSGHFRRFRTGGFGVKRKY